MSFHGGLIGILISSYLFAKKNESNIPPIKPSAVLFGLIEINLFFPNSLPKIYEKLSNNMTIKIKKLNFHPIKKYIFLNLITV